MLTYAGIIRKFKSHMPETKLKSLDAHFTALIFLVDVKLINFIKKSALMIFFMFID